MKILNVNSVTLAPGKYVISDPCYQVPNEYWDELLKSCNYFLDRIIGWYFPSEQNEKVQVVSFSTAYGDGCYLDQEGFEYGVDAGMIGIMLVDDLPNCTTGQGRIVEFDKPFECYEEDIHFGHIAIDTDPRGDEDE